MDRGPVALFGAIVAVGLGPALWLGAQFGNATITPERPPAVVEANNDTRAPGGAGAAPETLPVDKSPTKPRSGHVSPSAHPSTRSALTPVENPTTAPTTTEPTPSGEPSTPPTESTTEPAASPTPSDGQGGSDQGGGGQGGGDQGGAGSGGPVPPTSDGPSANRRSV